LAQNGSHDHPREETALSWPSIALSISTRIVPVILPLSEQQQKQGIFSDEVAFWAHWMHFALTTVFSISL